MKVSDRAKAEFEFYSNTSLDMIGHSVGVSVCSDPQGCSALECWYAKDTYGQTLPCCEPEVLSKVLRSKQSVNLQVKLWAEDVADGALLQQSELIVYTKGWPEWVFRATIEQASKIATKKVGFAPRFARVEYLYNNVWLPEMDGFDANI